MKPAISMSRKSPGFGRDGFQPLAMIGLGALSDEKLVERCRQNDHQAFGVLFKRFERPIYHLAYRLTQNRDDAQDVSAVVRLRIYRAIRKFKNAVALPAWINRIVVNAYFDSRRRIVRQAHITSLDSIASPAVETLLADKSDAYVSPQEMAEANECRNLLDRAIEALPRDQRLVVSLFHHKEHTYSEIAEILEVPIGTIKSRLNRARRLLRRSLTPQMSALLN